MSLSEAATAQAFEAAGKGAKEEWAEVIQFPVYLGPDRVSGSKNAEPAKLNDAVIRGEDSPEWQALKAQTMQFLTGTKGESKKWKLESRTLAEWLDREDVSKRQRGLTAHWEDPKKDGKWFVTASAVGENRRDNAVDEMFAVGLDLDNGDDAEQVIVQIEERGLAAFCYTTHSHMSDVLDPKRDAVLDALKIDREPTDDDLRTYFRKHDTKGYTDEIIDALRIEETDRLTADGSRIIARTIPIPKWRIVLFFAEPVTRQMRGATDKQRKANWTAAVKELGASFGVHIDQAATNIGRLFYTPRHKKGSEYKMYLVRGRGLTWDEIQPEINPFEIAGAEEKERKGYYAPSGAPLVKWIATHGQGFQPASLLEGTEWDTGKGKGDVLDIICPFGNQHSKDEGGGWVRDNDNGSWGWGCQHDSCANRDRLEFVEKALAEGWFTEDDIAADSQYIVLSDEDLERLEGLQGSQEPPKDENGEPVSLEERCGAFDNDSKAAEIEAFLKDLFQEGIDVTDRARVTDMLVDRTVLGKRDLNKMWATLDRVQAKMDKDKAKTESGVDAGDGILTTEPAPEQTQYAIDAIKAKNESDPAVFEYMEEPAIVRTGRLKTLNRAGKRHELGKVTKFWNEKGGEYQHIYPPYDVVDDVFSADLSTFLPSLKRVVDKPYFTATGELVSENGYHAGERCYLDSDLVLDRVSDEPTLKEAQAAALFIVEEVLADFPLGSQSRKEITETLFTAECAPAVANVLAMILQPFARSMIRGNTPGYVVNKPAPGTGAGYLVEVGTMISSGRPAAALAMPKNEEEMAKTLTAGLMDGEEDFFLDNINHNMDSAELASAMTAPESGYKARVLGKSQTVLVEILVRWIFAANTLTMSGELLRRCVLIDMDRGVANPAKWEPAGGWRHSDVKAWTKDNRAKLVHCCLTVIQYWVSEGMQKSDHKKASFENWAGVMGGILNACEIGGFLGNESELNDLSDDRDDELGRVIQAIVDKIGGKPVARLFTGSRTDKDNAKGRFGVLDILNEMPDVPRLDGWGYHNNIDGTVDYNRADAVGRGFKAASKKTFDVVFNGEEYTAKFTREEDGGKKVNYYTLSLTKRDSDTGDKD